MNKLFIIKSEKEINLLKENGIDNFVYPLFSFCVGVEKDEVIIESKGDLIVVIIVQDKDNRQKIADAFNNL